MRTIALLLALTLAGCASDVPRPIREAPAGNPTRPRLQCLAMSQGQTPERRAFAWRTGLAATLISAVTIAHYVTPAEHFLWHNVY